ncbi:MAG TPA: hypothetical protein HPQ00_15950, partial [Magnetococcales bacterium]|nr:hypothetical protein [Magnetococcales bacterium]
MPFAATILLVIGWIGFHADSVWGHGGEEHGDARPQQQSSLSSGLGNGAEGDLFEAVITPSEDGSAWIYLSDLGSNAPIAHAHIEVEASGTPGWTGKGETTAAEGVYHLNWTLPPNDAVDLTLTISGVNGSDLILVQVPAVTHTQAAIDPPRWDKQR